MPLSAVLDGIYRGEKRFKESSIIIIISSIFVIPLSFFFIKYLGMLGAILSFNLFYLVIGLFFIFIYKSFEFKVSRKFVSELFSYSALIGLANIGQYLYTKIDVVILGFFQYIVEIGYYSINFQIFSIVQIISGSIGLVMAPDSIIKYKNNYQLLRKDLDKI